MSVVVDSGRLESALSSGSLIDLLLAEQQNLSAVEQFAQWHDSHEPFEQGYSALIPTTAPANGQQYAFEVDLEACSGCKACVVACHERNGLDPTETWREVGLLYGGTAELPVLQHVTTACHHCLEPACLRGCPVKAYEKDPQTGIVHHLDDQCIGCQYCIFACPYDVPKYNAAKGIVRKCDMCSGRLAMGEPPACVQACPNEAIRITVVEVAAVAEGCESESFLAGAPDPRLTLPTTKYVGSPAFASNLRPGNYYSVNPEHAHWPLIFMLVLSQGAVGALTVQSLLAVLRGDASHAGPMSIAAVLTIQIAALVASVFHLGRPRLAYRAVLGLRTSWLSREILAFGAFTLALIVCWCLAARQTSPGLYVAALLTALGAGWSGVLCSAFVYIVTRREFWNAAATLSKFALTCAVLGCGTDLLLLSLLGADVFGSAGRTICGFVILATLLKIAAELSVLRHLTCYGDAALKRSALLLAGELAPTVKVRLISALAGGISLPLAWLAVGSDPSYSPILLAIVAASIVAVLLTGELLERYLFFTAVVAPKMPKGL